MIRDIVVLVDGAAHTEGVGDCALLLASMFSSHLTIVGLPRDPGHVMHLAHSPARVLKEALHQAQTAAEADAARIEKAAAARGVSCAHQTVEVPAADYPALIEKVTRRFDICVMPLPSFESYSEDEKLFEGPLFRSGRPVLAVPRGAPAPEAFERVAVAWDGGREAARAVGDAMPIMARAKAVEIMTIAGRNGADDHEPPGCHIAGHLARHGASAEFRRLDGRDAPAKLLLARAEEAGSNLMVMGAYRHSRWRQAVLGGATRDMMQATKIPLLMAR